VVIACFPAVAARANDRDLRGTTVPAAACEVYRALGDVGPFQGWDAVAGLFRLKGSGEIEKRLEIRCPLPINNVDLSGGTNDNDVSKYRVHFQDSDGPGTDGALVVRFFRSSPAASGRPACNDWTSRVTSLARLVVVDCPHDVENGAFYQFLVVLSASGDAEVRFWGIDFP
jgi:hypothetical protein